MVVAAIDDEKVAVDLPDQVRELFEIPISPHRTRIVGETTLIVSSKPE